MCQLISGALRWYPTRYQGVKGSRRRFRPTPDKSRCQAASDKATRYQELGGDYFRRRQDRERVAQRLVRQLERLGQRVTLEPVA